MTKTTKIILWSVGGLSVLAGAYFGYKWYKKSKGTGAGSSDEKPKDFVQMTPEEIKKTGGRPNAVKK